MPRLNQLAALAALATALISAQAMNPDATYRIVLTKDTSGLDIAIRTFDGPAVAVGLENRSGKPAQCTASFVNYPHKPSLDETRRVTIEAGKSGALVYPALKFGVFSTAYVNVKCVEKKPAV